MPYVTVIAKNNDGTRREFRFPQAEVDVLPCYDQTLQGLVVRAHGADDSGFHYYETETLPAGVTTQTSTSVLATSATITRDAIVIDGQRFPFAVLDDVEVTPGRVVNHIHLTIPVNGPVVCEGEGDPTKENR